MTFVYVDYETRCLLDLPTVGTDRYVEKAEILMVGLGFEDGETVVRSDLRHFIFLEADARDVTFVSWGDFDRNVAQWVEGMIVPNWINAANLARMVGLPGGLQKFCSSIGIPAKKDARGTRLINKYSKPQKDGTFLVLEGEDREAFEDYCLQDVRLLQQAWRFLSPLVSEWHRCHAERAATYDKMNARGVPIDVEAAKLALDACTQQAEEIEIACRYKHGFSITQVEKVRDFLGTVDCTRQTLESFKTKDPDKIWLRDARLLVSKAATKKLVPMIDMASDDGRVRGAFQYHGAHTGRGSSHGVQFQNLKKAKIDPSYFDRLHSNVFMEDPTGECQRNIRGFIKAPVDHTFVIVDYAQVEARIVAWIANERPLVEAFVEGRDIYKEFAARVYGVTIDTVTDSQRAHGKAAILGCGYGMGPDRFVVQAGQQGIDVPFQTAQKLVGLYRSAYSAIPLLWNEIDTGIKRLLWGHNDVFSAGRCTFTVNKHRTMLRVELPSQRVLRYFMPKVEDNQIVYQGRFGPTHCWGGHFVENICQAIAGDLKVDAMQRADKLGYRTVMEVHDELVIEEANEICASTLNMMLMVMADPPEWMDEPGLIKGEGKLSDRFTK